MRALERRRRNAGSQRILELGVRRQLLAHLLDTLERIQVGGPVSTGRPGAHVRAKPGFSPDAADGQPGRAGEKQTRITKPAIAERDR